MKQCRENRMIDYDDIDGGRERKDSLYYYFKKLDRKYTAS